MNRPIEILLNYNRDYICNSMNRPIKKKMKCMHIYRRSPHREEMKSTFTPEYRIYLMYLDVTKAERVLCRMCCCNIVSLSPSVTQPYCAANQGNNNYQHHFLSQSLIH